VPLFRNSVNGLFASCAAVILILWSAKKVGEDLVFAVAGQSVIGHVVDSEPPGHETRAYTDYEYHVRGRGYQGLQEGPELTPDRPVSVRYLTFSPSNSRIANQTWFPLGLLAMTVGAGLLVFGIWCFKSNDTLADN
jgi:hypothetical protein